MCHKPHQPSTYPLQKSATVLKWQFKSVTASGRPWLETMWLRTLVCMQQWSMNCSHEFCASKSTINPFINPNPVYSLFYHMNIFLKTIKGRDHSLKTPTVLIFIFYERYQDSFIVLQYIFCMKVSTNYLTMRSTSQNVNYVWYKTISLTSSFINTH